MKASLDLTRRGFLKSAGGTTAALSTILGHGASRPTVGSAIASVESQAERGDAKLVVQNGKIHVESKTLTAIIDRGLLTSLQSKLSGEEYIRPFDLDQTAALSLLYPSSEEVVISEQRFGKSSVRQLSAHQAEVTFQNWDGDGVIRFSVDPESGDLLVEPSAYSSRPGVTACRWKVMGIREDLQLVAPFFQGVRMDLDDTLIRETRWEWPTGWEAGLAILQSERSGFWVHTQDNRYRYKALQVGSEKSHYSLGFDTEAYGPIDDNLAAGGLAWRVNVFKGDWHSPAERYRQWLWRAYSLDRAEQSRADWIYRVKLALSWCPTDLEILDALSKKVDPKKVLLHFPRWRSDPYDENYPDFNVSAAGRQFLAKGQELGFRVMPHFNSIDMDPVHPVYRRVRDFQYRRVENKKLWGWSWIEGQAIGVPESNDIRTQHRNHKVMVKIHPGLGMWRSILRERIHKAAQELGLETVFLDVTLNTGNLHNCLVEGLTSSEGMNRLIHEVGALGNGLAVGGEGLNETTFSGISFGQVHLFKSWHSSIEGLERTGGCDLNNQLFGKITRTFGYSRLNGRSETEQLRMRIHDEHGAIPTITVRSANEILNPNPTVKRILERAAG